MGQAKLRQQQQERRASDPLHDLLDRARSASDARDRLVAVRELRERLDDVERDAWLTARRSGLSWSVLATALGMGKSGAQRRCAALVERQYR